MAVLNGKLYFSWVQRSRLCIPDPTRKPAISLSPLGLSKISTRPVLVRVHRRLSAVRFFSVLCRQNGGLR